MFHSYSKEYVQHVVLAHDIALAVVQLSLLLLPQLLLSAGTRETKMCKRG